MNTEELKEKIADGEETAFELLIDAMPQASTRFHKAADTLAKLLKDVRKHFPEARYYTSGGDGFALILGETHSGRGETPNNELSALESDKLQVMGGDW
ncbi:hypothetical protein [Enterobacter kobei]|uniref:hypothetical protein n=1 Tax=Enterobacter kobei TaxID=208224 RepID=UPI0011ED7E64|nr:hypothetical protein [Enterobacter kobei]QEO01368.1 hypothetical protein FZO55_11380 [Enterobacter kobei]